MEFKKGSYIFVPNKEGHPFYGGHHFIWREDECDNGWFYVKSLYVGLNGYLHIDEDGSLFSEDCYTDVMLNRSISDGAKLLGISDIVKRSLKNLPERTRDAILLTLMSSMSQYEDKNGNLWDVDVSAITEYILNNANLSDLRGFARFLKQKHPKMKFVCNFKEW